MNNMAHSDKEHIETVSIKRKDGNKLSTKESLIWESCRKFFSSNIKYIKTMYTIIDGFSPISIRAIDWFVANYSKKNNTRYKIMINGEIKIFNVNIEYKNQLYGNTKLYLDPFCRKNKIIFKYLDENNNVNKFSTSIGQINFFHWAIRNKVIAYVERHLKQINEDMKLTAKLNNIRKSEEKSDSEQDSNDTRSPKNFVPDPVICSNSEANILYISSSESKTRNSSEKRRKRQQLSKSVFDKGVVKSNISVKINLD